MEPIKIVDKLTLRQEALRMAVIGVDNNVNADFIAVRAKTFESYLQGSAVLPEYADQNKQFKEMFDKMNERWTPSTPWLSADTLKPETEMDVVGRCGDDNYVCRFDGEDWYTIDTDERIRPTHWMPIHPLTQPTKL